MQFDDMPESDNPNMVQIKMSIPAPLLEQSIEMAKADGWPQATLWRDFWVTGFFEYCEKRNKRLVNKRLSDKDE